MGPSGGRPTRWGIRVHLIRESKYARPWRFGSHQPLEVPLVTRVVPLERQPHGRARPAVHRRVPARSYRENPCCQFDPRRFVHWRRDQAIGMGHQCRRQRSDGVLAVLRRERQKNERRTAGTGTDAAVWIEALAVLPTHRPSVRRRPRTCCGRRALFASRSLARRRARIGLHDDDRNPDGWDRRHPPVPGAPPGRRPTAPALPRSPPCLCLAPPRPGCRTAAGTGSIPSWTAARSSRGANHLDLGRHQNATYPFSISSIGCPASTNRTVPVATRSVTSPRTVRPPSTSSARASSSTSRGSRVNRSS